MSWSGRLQLPVHSARQCLTTAQSESPGGSYLFNLTSLYNNTEDHRISANGSNFILNVCGELVGDCSCPNEVCFSHERDLTYEEGTLVMRQTSTQSCPSNPGH